MYINLKAHAPLPPALNNSTTKRVGAVIRPFWAALAAFLGPLEDWKRHETVIGPFVAALKPLLGPLKLVLERSWGALGPLGPVLKLSWGPLGAFFGL